MNARQRPTPTICPPRNVPTRLRQGGYATLGIAAVLLLVLSLITIYLTRSGIIDIRTSANKARYAQALADAERKLEIGLSWLGQSANRNPATFTPASWQLCSHSAFNGLKVQAGLGANWRCLSQSITYTVNTVGPVTATTSFVISTPAATDAIGKSFFVVAEGSSDNGAGAAVVKQGVYFYSSNGGAANAPPMMGAGNVPLNGNFTVVANPNSGGSGVPVSIWSKSVIDVPSGTAATCQLGEYRLAGDNCTGAAVISSSAGKGPDIVDNDPLFPSDVFEYLFGVPTLSYGTVKTQAQIVADCSNLVGKTGTVWVTGNCTIPSGTVVGSADAPLQLIVEKTAGGGDFTMNANSTFYGLLFAFGPPALPYVPSAPYNAGDIKANGGAKFYGSMVSNDTVTMGVQINGTFDMIYLKDVMDKINNPANTQFKTMARIPGSWADFL